MYHLINWISGTCLPAPVGCGVSWNADFEELYDWWSVAGEDFELRTERSQVYGYVWKERSVQSIGLNSSWIPPDLLWTAPELLRTDDIRGSKEGDVYSLGIICGELISRKSVFNMEDRKEDPEEIIYMLKKGGMKSPRPDLDHYDPAIEINPALVSQQQHVVLEKSDIQLHLVRDCWTERPSERPTIVTVRSQLRGMNSSRNDNLMDHVFNMLEGYASSLEEEVSERTKELVEEKKKSDVLLYRMLPKLAFPHFSWAVFNFQNCGGQAETRADSWTGNFRNGHHLLLGCGPVHNVGEQVHPASSCQLAQWSLHDLWWNYWETWCL